MLYYVKDVLWQVESEFARDSRQLLFDFNKLVLGSAQSKLFVMSRFHDITSQIDIFRPAAAACSGRIYLALVPHPDSWDGRSSGVQVLEFESSINSWQPYK